MTASRLRRAPIEWQKHRSAALFVLPAVLFTAAMVIFPMLFGVYVAFTDWNLSAFAGRRFNGLDNIRQLKDHGDGTATYAIDLSR